MTATLAPLSPADPLAGCLPRLARRAGRTSARPDVGAHSSSAAFVTLSPGLMAVLEHADGTVVSHQELGAAGLSAHHAWNDSARALVPEQIEFWVRPASSVWGAPAPRGLQVAGDAARWLAHPMLFTALDTHFRRELSPDGGLCYLTRDWRDLFVFAADPAEVAAALDLTAGACLVRYSLGFPLLALC